MPWRCGGETSFLGRGCRSGSRRTGQARASRYDRPRMGRIDDRLKELGITLPVPRAPAANYIPARRVGSLVYTAGQVSGSADREIKGKLGEDLTVEQGR